MCEPPKISVAIITSNEADRLIDCVHSVEWADEIIVVDSGSSDGTGELAESLGCTLHHHPFSGFGPQKQFAVDQCRNPWVLILDADERLPPSAAEQVPRIVASAVDEPVAFSFQRKNYLHRRWIRRCGWWPDKVVRLVRRDRGAFSAHAVHERWLADGTVGDLSDTIDHHSFRNYAEMIDKLQHYSTLAASQMASRHTRVYCWSAIGHGCWTFFHTYFLKLGLLCGFDGLIISLLNAGGSFMKYAKWWEIKRFGPP